MKKKMEKAEDPMALPGNRRAARMAEDAADCESRLTANQRMGAIEGVRLGLEGMKQKRGMSACKFFARFFARNNISER